MARFMKTYNVRYEKDATGWWVVTVKGIAGCHSQGRTINQARKRIREALSLFVDDADSADLVDDIVLPAKLSALVKAAHKKRKTFESAQIELNKTAEMAAKALTKDFSLGVRDASEVLGISYQRVQQLATKVQRKKT